MNRTINIALIASFTERSATAPPTSSPSTAEHEIGQSIRLQMISGFISCLWPMLVHGFFIFQARIVSVAAGGDATDSFPYLYATRSNYNASFPVIEYIAPTENSKLNDDRPAFLYDKNQPARIINWYGHWCTFLTQGHCDPCQTVFLILLYLRQYV
jgi:hypothetical protein